MKKIKPTNIKTIKTIKPTESKCCRAKIYIIDDCQGGTVDFCGKCKRRIYL